MSNSLAIAAVTATLRALLENGLRADVPSTVVTTLPPDSARTNTKGNQVNLFLYQPELSAPWRNMDIPRQVRTGESPQPPLGLNLYYLITAYGHDNNETLSHRLLGRAMSILYDHVLLGADEIRAATETELPDSDLHRQVERVRITHQPLSLEEMSKLWSTFHTQYRISAAYQVAVVLIESTRPVRTPLPVLKRGPDDRGVETLIGPFPALEEIRRPPGERPGVQLGDLLEILGANMQGEIVRVRFTHVRFADGRLLVPKEGSTATKLQVELPLDFVAQAEWAAGLYLVVAVVTKVSGEPPRISNTLPLVLAPRVTRIDPPSPVPRDDNGNVTLTITCSPQVRPEQRAALLLGEREIQAEPHEVQTDTLTFKVEQAPTGTFVIRVRIDGVDSLPVKQKDEGLIFDPDQKVTIT